MTAAMDMLAAQAHTVFIGQAVKVPGTAMSGTLVNVPQDRRIEFPVAEEMQMGVTIGMALQGLTPVSIFTRWNFLVLAANQLVNHLDKVGLMGFRPRIIIRTGVGSLNPMNPGPQHLGDFTDAFRMICWNINFVKLHDPEQIVPAYAKALKSEKPTVLVEISDLYND